MNQNKLLGSLELTLLHIYKNSSGCILKFKIMTFREPLHFKSLLIEYKMGVTLNMLPQLSSVTQLCPTVCDPMDCSMPGFPVLHYLPRFAHTHVHWVGDTIQPSHPLSLPSCLALNLSQHQGLFHWVGSSHQEAKLLELQHQPFQWIFRGLVKSKSLVSNWTTGRPSLKLSNLGKLLLIRFEFICFYFDHSFLSESLFLLTRI